MKKETRILLRSIYADSGTDNYRTFLEGIGDVLTDDLDVLKLETLLENKDVIKYLNKTKHFSANRFRNTLSKIADKMVRNVNVSPIIEIIKIINSEEYIKCVKLYFTPPADYELFSIFEQMVINISAQNPNHAKILFNISEKKILIDIKNLYKEEFKESFKIIIAMIEKLILQFKDSLIVEKICENIITEKFKWFAKIFEDKEDFNKEQFNLFWSNLSIFFLAANDKSINNFFVILFKLKIDLLASVKTYKERRRLILKLIPVIAAIDEETRQPFFDFIKSFPYSKDGPSELLWNVIFEFESKEKLIKLINFFISLGFINFYNFYRYESEILIFLLKHIIILVNDVDIRNFPKSLLPLVLKLFLEQKIDRHFLKKRTEFAKWLSQKTKSEIIKSVYVRILFYEYIFLFQKKFEVNKNIVLKQFCDTFHESFCKVIDETFDIYMKAEIKEKLFEKLYLLSRGDAWKPVFERFPKDGLLIKELSNISESLDNDDMAITELMKVEERFIKKYHCKIIEIIKNDPQSKLLADAFYSDYWARFYFEKAQFFISEALIYLLGNINIYPDEKNGAYTDGKVIFLPRYISHFQDDPEDTENNRNLSLYISIAFHEAGHIISGSFIFDYRPLYIKYEYPKLLKNIHNAFEDVRIEKYLKKIKAHSQINELLDSMNIFLSYKKDFCVIDTFIINIMNMSEGYDEVIEKLNPDKLQKIERILNMNLNTGRFSSLKNLRGYISDRVKNMDIVNPMETFYIAEELYQIIKLWPKELIEEAGFFMEEENIAPQIHKKEILSGEELEKLYEECNADPMKFYESNGMKVFSGALDKDQESAINRIMEELELNTEMAYEASGTFDTACYTKVDEIGAKRQKEFSLKESVRKVVETLTGAKREKSKKKSKTRGVRSYSKLTNSKSAISYCKEFEINAINRRFLNENKKYDHIIRKIYTMLNGIFINFKSNITENSSIEGEIDIERLIEILADKNSYNEPDFLEYYVEDLKTLRVIIGLDISGSTFRNVNDNCNVTILDVEKHFALIFAKSLKMITDNVDIYAFNSVTSTNVYRAVPFEAVSSLVSDNGNRDGDFIRYIGEILSQSKEELKYFFLISDGQPSSVNYDGKEALEDTLLALRECRKKGIKVCYFNIDSFLREYFYYFKNEVVYAEYFANPSEIIDIVPELVKKIADEVV
ncbi:MAG TPA: hypothetical protein PLO95_03655 [Spirochaetota bacterium]|nr:hypothetical protein [Spirochaetota bacterium]HPK61730.1 hypothetical protein [Spirochaetota bacterium]HQH31293.1 hypothetical protein [Spirochaetota bacterium]